ncbi:MAG: hypothetical protein C4547_10540 [Phycisphaerales bacterium]|nr:MAG: hypothetical protein C4547_10540 [Phycisphaerales bacterium]
MREEPDKLDPEFSLSRELDGDLTADERHSLDARLRQDASLRELRQAYARLDVLLPRDEPDVDWARLHDAVMAKIGARSRRRRRPLRRILRIGVPLAAAAAVVFALVGPTFFWPQTRGPRTRRVAIVEVTIERPATLDDPAGSIAAADAEVGRTAADRPFVHVALARSAVQPIDAQVPPKRRMLVAAGGVRTGIKASAARGPF